MRVLLITPPLLQCNAPYPATPLLAAWLRQAGYNAVQADASLGLLLRLFSADGLRRVRDCLARQAPSPALAYFREQAESYITWVEPVVRYLQGRDTSLAHRLARPGVLPEGPRFEALRQQEIGPDGTLAWAFGSLGTVDEAHYRASLFIDDVANAIRIGVDPGFGLARYEESLCQSLQCIDPLLERLEGPPTLVDTAIDDLAAEILGTQKLRVAALTVPFPGTLYGALRMARALRRLRPEVKVILGGGYISTELRALAEPRLFRYVDYVCLDRGFMPMLGVLRHMMTGDDGDLVRTFTAAGGRVVFHDHPVEEPRHADLPVPCTQGLPLDRYIGLAEMLNPMHVLWSRQRWNKIMAAHGCYWHRCAFCDTTLDYIRNYDPAPPARIADWMAALQDETGSAGFHIVDEALSPALARGLSEEILRRGMVVSWWGNVRFEAAFDDDLTRLMAQAGCIAVTGGLEALDDRLLGVLNKGITVAQAARACAALSRAGLMVHAYLIYGVPSQTTQETVDALERLRQMVALGLIQSAYWHRFAATAHSPVGTDPARFGVTLQRCETAFAENEIPMADPADEDREALGRGLHRATYNYMHGRELDRDVRTWFDVRVPRPRVPRDAIERCLRGDDGLQASPAEPSPPRRSAPGRLQPRPPRRPRPY